MSADPSSWSDERLLRHANEWLDLPLTQPGPIAVPSGHPEYRLDGYLAQEGINEEDVS